jgi:hypothetical protein
MNGEVLLDVPWVLGYPLLIDSARAHSSCSGQAP